MPALRNVVASVFALFIFDAGFARAGVDEIRLNESSFQLRFEGLSTNDAAKIDRQFLHHVATAVRKHGFDKFVFRVPTENSAAVVLVQGALSYQPATYAKSHHVREAIVISYKKAGAPPDAFDAKLILENPLPADEVTATEPAHVPLPPASEVLPSEAAMAPPPPREVAPEPASPALSPVPSPRRQQELSYSRETSGIGFGLLMPTSSRIRFDDVKAYGGGAFLSGTAEFGLETTPGFALEYFQRVDQGWGFRAGVMLEKPREFRDFKITLNGVSSSFTSNGGSAATLQFMTFYASGEFTSGNMSFPIGLNITNATFTPVTNTGSFDYSGGLGMQGGVSFQMNPHLSLELLCLVNTIQMKQKENGVTIDLGTGYQSAINFGLKFQIPVDGR